MFLALPAQYHATEFLLLMIVRSSGDLLARGDDGYLSPRSWYRVRMATDATGDGNESDGMNVLGSWLVGSWSSEVVFLGRNRFGGPCSSGLQYMQAYLESVSPA